MTSTLARTVPDDYETLEPGDRVLLVVEDDLTFAMTMLEMARASGFKGVVATSGHAGARARARRSSPMRSRSTSACPTSMAGSCSTGSSTIAATRHIPVHVVSGLDEERRSLQYGALGFLQKPVTAEDLRAGLASVREFVEKRVKQLLVVEDDPVQSQAISDSDR